MTARLEKILADAETVANEIRDQAERDAARLLAERRRSAEREIGERERQLERGLTVLRDGLARLVAERDRLVQEVESVLPTLGEARSDPADQEDDDPASGSARGVNRSRESAIIFATQMVIDGVPRRQIETRLSAEFGIPEPAPIVDEILTRT